MDRIASMPASQTRSVSYRIGEAASGGMGPTSLSPVRVQTLTCRPAPPCLLPPAADMTPLWLGAAMCHVWTAPSWQELSSRLQHWSVQPCVRPLDAFHMTAGHNALRGSGPGQKPAFEMHWHMWVVLIAGSTGSALRAVRSPKLHITP